MNNQKFNFKNEDELIFQLQQEINKNYERIENEKRKVEKLTIVVKIIYIMVGLWMLSCVGSCVIEELSNNTSNSSGCME